MFSYKTQMAQHDGMIVMGRRPRKPRVYSARLLEEMIPEV